MGSKRATDPLGDVALSGSQNYQSTWKTGLRREFNKGDLVTLAPEFRYSIAISRPDFGRYLGIVVETFANREYMVVWTNQPLTMGHKKGMFNGDHLIKVENAGETLMHANKKK